MDKVAERMEKMIAKFDITGQGTILDTVTEKAPARTTPVRVAAPPAAEPPTDDVNGRRGKRKPNHKQQLKHALTVNAAHVITIDYLTLSQPLADGLLLMDRTERKLKLVHSLGELRPLHRYTTEYGNVLERTSKHRALLAGSIELEIETDEIDFDAALGAHALSPEADGSNQPKSLQTPERMATYAAFASRAKTLPTKVSANEDDDAVSVMEETERLQESEALRRIATLVSRMAEMEEWFDSVKAEAVSERTMREQSNARLQLAQERIERMQEQVSSLQAENLSLRERLVDVQLADSVASGAGARAGTISLNSL